MYRTAAKTCPNWQQWISQLRESAQAKGSLQMIATGNFSPDFWDTKPFAACLEDAWLGFPSDPSWSSPGTQLVNSHQENMFPSAPIPGISFDPKVQALAYKVLHQYSGKSDLFETVGRRIANWLGYIPIEFVPDQFEFASSLLRKMRCHEAMQIVKTWTNSWVTSVRYH